MALRKVQKPADHSAAVQAPVQQTQPIRRSSRLFERDLRKSSPLERLPSEILLMILRFTPDCQTLASLSQSCSTVYGAFKGEAGSRQRQTNTILAVLGRQLDSLILPELAVAARAATIRPSLGEIDQPKFVVDYHRDRMSILQSVTWKDARAMVRLHEDVDALASEYCQYAAYEHLLFLRKYPNRSDQYTSSYSCNPSAADERTFNEAEFRRVKRALIRFELISNRFKLEWEWNTARCDRFCSIVEQHYLSYFSAWENAQLGCIWQWLAKRATGAFVDHVKRDIAWATYKRSVDFENGFERPLDILLCRGLSYLRKLFTLQSYQDRQELLKDMVDAWGNRNHCFIHRALCGESGLSFRYGKIFQITPMFSQLGGWSMTGSALNIFEDEDRERIIGQPFFTDDEDPGPRAGWSWAHLDPNANGIYRLDLPGGDELRLWGYCMWNKDRLARLGVFRTLFIDWLRDTHVEIQARSSGVHFLHPNQQDFNASKGARFTMWQYGVSGDAGWRVDEADWDSVDPNVVWADEWHEDQYNRRNEPGAKESAWDRCICGIGLGMHPHQIGGWKIPKDEVYEDDIEATV